MAAPREVQVFASVPLRYDGFKAQMCPPDDASRARRAVHNHPMLFLRNPHTNACRLARWVLLCFALSLGVAIASPLTHPQAMELVCSSAGAVKLLVTAPDGSTQVLSQMGDCPLCTTAGAPPPAPVHLGAALIQPLSYVLRSIPAAHIAYLTAAPLPARGPPASA
jgi:hypothetical protein